MIETCSKLRIIISNYAMLSVFIALTVTGCDDRSDSSQSDSERHTSDRRALEMPRVVFLVNEDPNNYEAHVTIPRFAGLLSNESGLQTKVIQGQGELPAIHFPDLEIVKKADLLVVFFRRTALSHEQMEVIRTHLTEGKPIVALRTANHAFSVRSRDGEIPEGFSDWWDFVPDVLGCENRGYGSTELGTKVSVAQGMETHPIMAGVEPEKWHSTGNVYHVAPLLDEEAEILLYGTAGEEVEPIAWTRRAGESRIFYTSLGYPDDFDYPPFRQLLMNAMYWAMEDTP